MEIKICLICKKEYKKNPKWTLSQWEYSKYCSFVCRNKGIGGENHPLWKGDGVGYNALHAWVKRHLKKPKWCENCFVAYPYDLANKGIYNRDLKNWEWLCRSCHMRKDERINNLNKGYFEGQKRGKDGRFYV